MLRCLVSDDCGEMADVSFSSDVCTTMIGLVA